MIVDEAINLSAQADGRIEQLDRCSDLSR